MTIGKKNIQKLTKPKSAVQLASTPVRKFPSSFVCAYNCV